MELKRYQKGVLEVTRAFLDRLAQEQGAGASNRHPSLDAWTAATGRDLGYRERKNALGKDLPTFCVKVPTGGGKTLLATQILGQIYSTILRPRNGAGLALWIVPSDQIYKDTLKALRDRRHLYRESLEFSVGRRIEVWEKHEIARMTPTQLAENQNILMLKLASANRATQEQLRMFQDSGGNIVLHFPAEDDPGGHRKLRERVPNLDLLAEDLVKTSLGNLVRLCEPPVILDEGHKAYSDLAQKTLEGFNASIIVELSATPPEESNVVCRVTGAQLLDEEMIKLPINIASSAEADWKTCLAKAKDKRAELAQLSERQYGKTGRLIRPIVLVQVERTGKDQRVAPYIHSLDVQQHLIERLGVSREQIAIKTSDTDGLEDKDLLDESFVYCLRKKARDILKEIKGALEDEGYEGDESSIVDRSGESPAGPRQLAIFRPEFRRMYREFEGKIYLPRFCVKNGSAYEAFDYFRHLLSEVEVDRFRYETIDWNLTDEMDRAKEVFFRMTLGQKDLQAVGQRELRQWEDDGRVRAWLVANLPFEHYSSKELRRVVEASAGCLPRCQGKLGLVKYIVRDKLAGFIEEETDRQTHAAFKRLYDSGRLCFYLKCVECRFQMPPEIMLKSLRRLVHADTHGPLERSLFDTVSEASFNDYEKEVALCLDRHPEVLWWFRNEVGSQYFSIQGYKKDRIFPDFVVQKGERKKPSPEVLVVETKGEHLVGNVDTEYKRDVAKYFEKLGRSVSWQKLGEGFENATFRFQVLDQGEHNGWKDELLRMLGEE